jgi:hypothetical protein
MPVPTYSVKIGWNSAQAGLLVFDFSAFQTVSGVVQTTDVFGNAYFAFFNGTYDDVTEDVQSIRIRRGRDDILSQMNAGTAELEMMRPSDRAYWNPANKSSLLNSANAPGFVPMRPIRIQATDPASGTTYGLFWGFIRSARFDYATGICRLSCTDLMLVLSRVNPLDPALATTEGGTGSDSYTPDAGTATDADQSTTAAKSRSGFVRLA